MKIPRRLRALGLMLAGAGLISASAVAAAELKVGDQAPEFALTGSDAQVHRLSDYRGKYVVLAFFPKAFTSG